MCFGGPDVHLRKCEFHDSQNDAPMDMDLAMKEAIRRSIEDMQKKDEAPTAPPIEVSPPHPPPPVFPCHGPSSFPQSRGHPMSFGDADVRMCKSGPHHLGPMSHHVDTPNDIQLTELNWPFHHGPSSRGVVNPYDVHLLTLEAYRRMEEDTKTLQRLVGLKNIRLNDEVKKMDETVTAPPSDPSTDTGDVQMSDSKGLEECNGKVEEPTEPSVEQFTSTDRYQKKAVISTAPTAEENHKDASFASDAAGYGDVAEGLGEALDKVANAIDEMNLELNRTSVTRESEESDDEAEIVVETVSTTIVDGEDDDGSHNSWHVVCEGNQMESDEALARATQVIGSALFNSDMGRSQEKPTSHNESISSSSSSSFSSSVSTATSVPTVVPQLDANVRVPAPEQLAHWAIQLIQLHELGFYNDNVSVDILERLNAANIGVGSSDVVTVQQVIHEMMKDWH
jgi:hypothetical protein